MSIISALTSGRSIPARALRQIQDFVEAAPMRDAMAATALHREQQGEGVELRDNRYHVRHAVDWLARAQDATADRGVSRGFSIAWSRDLRLRGWQPSYPETTGYIIPTLYDCAAYLKDPSLRYRAAEMADWECKVQMASGAVMGGTIGRGEPQAAVFNTGQVMLGWLRAAKETDGSHYLKSCTRAAEYLMSVQEPEGGWHKGNSTFANSKSTTYNSRVGWALICFGQQVGRQDAVDAGKRNIAYSLTKQHANGWFADNCLSDPQRPLLHTIVYAMEGVLGAYDALEHRPYLDAVVRAADSLIHQIRPDGSLPGRFEQAWKGTVQWACLTGCAQLAGVLLRIAAATEATRYQDEARRILTFLKRTQDCTTDVLGIRGGIRGSFPLDGDYGKFEVLNWATKFYIDALLLDDAFLLDDAAEAAATAAPNSSDR